MVLQIQGRLRFERSLPSARMRQGATRKSHAFGVDCSKAPGATPMAWQAPKKSTKSKASMLFSLMLMA
jgi:hypothetical protein